MVSAIRSTSHQINQKTPSVKDKQSILGEILTKHIPFKTKVSQSVEYGQYVKDSEGKETLVRINHTIICHPQSSHETLGQSESDGNTLNTFKTTLYKEIMKGPLSENRGIFHKKTTRSQVYALYSIAKQYANHAAAEQPAAAYTIKELETWCNAFFKDTGEDEIKLDGKCADYFDEINGTASKAHGYDLDKIRSMFSSASRGLFQAQAEKLSKQEVIQKLQGIFINREKLYKKVDEKLDHVLQDREEFVKESLQAAIKEKAVINNVNDILEYRKKSDELNKNLSLVLKDRGKLNSLIAEHIDSKLKNYINLQKYLDNNIQEELELKEKIKNLDASDYIILRNLVLNNLEVLCHNQSFISRNITINLPHSLANAIVILASQSARIQHKNFDKLALNEQKKACANELESVIKEYFKINPNNNLHGEISLAYHIAIEVQANPESYTHFEEFVGASAVQLDSRYTKYALPDKAKQTKILIDLTSNKLEALKLKVGAIYKDFVDNNKFEKTQLEKIKLSSKVILKNRSKLGLLPSALDKTSEVHKFREICNTEMEEIDTLIELVAIPESLQQISDTLNNNVQELTSEENLIINRKLQGYRTLLTEFQTKLSTNPIKCKAIEDSLEMLDGLERRCHDLTQEFEKIPDLDSMKHELQYIPTALQDIINSLNEDSIKAIKIKDLEGFSKDLKKYKIILTELSNHLQSEKEIAIKIGLAAKGDADERLEQAGAVKRLELEQAIINVLEQTINEIEVTLKENMPQFLENIQRDFITIDENPLTITTLSKFKNDVEKYKSVLNYLYVEKDINDEALNHSLQEFENMLDRQIKLKDGLELLPRLQSEFDKLNIAEFTTIFLSNFEDRVKLLLEGLSAEDGPEYAKLKHGLEALELEINLEKTLSTDIEGLQDVIKDYVRDKLNRIAFLELNGDIKRHRESLADLFSKYGRKYLELDKKLNDCEKLLNALDAVINMSGTIAKLKTEFEKFLEQGKNLTAKELNDKFIIFKETKTKPCEEFFNYLSEDDKKLYTKKLEELKNFDNYMDESMVVQSLARLLTTSSMLNFTAPEPDIVKDLPNFINPLKKELKECRVKLEAISKVTKLEYPELEQQMHDIEENINWGATFIEK